jgi:benzylsuccinate CoA-transferase BbsF subunit
MPSVGDSGPLRDILAYAPIIQALSGLMSLVGYQQDEPLVGELQSPWSDAVSAIFAALAAVAALRHRSRTGQGQYVEVAQLEATTTMLGEAILGYQMTGDVARPQGNFDPEFAPHNNYTCAGEDEFVSIAVGTDQEWRGFCQALGNPGWTADPRFATRYERLQRTTELDQHVTAWTRRKSAQEITDLLQGHGVAAMPVMNIEDQFIDPHLQERQVYVDIEHPHVGVEWLYGLLGIFSDTPGGVRVPAPLMGQHNGFVFQELLGLPAEELKRLEGAQAVY